MMQGLNMSVKILALLSIAFIAGLLIGEYQACPREAYSLEYGCKIK